MTDHDYMYFHLVTLTTIGCIAELVGIVYSTREWGDIRAWSYSLYKAMKKDIKISVQKFEMRRLGNDERHRAMGMLDGGMSFRQVARHFGCSPSTIIILLQRHRETGSVNDRPRSGRERVTTPDQDRYIVLQHLCDRFLTASEMAAATPGRHQPRISGNTVWRRLYESDLRARRPATSPKSADMVQKACQVDAKELEPGHVLRRIPFLFVKARWSWTCVA